MQVYHGVASYRFWLDKMLARDSGLSQWRLTDKAQTGLMITRNRLGFDSGVFLRYRFGA